MLDTTLHFVNGIVILLAGIFGYLMNICLKVNYTEARNGIVRGYKGYVKNKKSITIKKLKGMNKYGWAK